MDGRGGCCIARYGGGGGGVYGYDSSKVDRIMLRFRPIAPKPVVGGGEAAERGSEAGVKKIGSGRRRQRKSVSKRCNDNDDDKKKKRKLLPLLPEKPEGMKPSAAAAVAVAVGSSVTVECVTEMWTAGDGLGSTDEERRVSLERDTCPGFVSDGFGRVTWTNRAYADMAAGPGGDLAAVWLVLKEGLPAAAMLACAGFTCRVRLRCHVDGGDASPKTMPCDVWRLDGGGFAWRLDVDAALCLGR